MKCEHCGNKQQELNPPAEEYLENKFCINIFGWKLMLYREHIEYGCTSCIQDEQDAQFRGAMDEAVYYAINREIERGNLTPNN